MIANSNRINKIGDQSDKTYEKIGLDDNLRPIERYQEKHNYEMSSDWDMRRERTPYMNPTQLSKGVLKQTFGGSTTFYDVTGGTVIFSYDPVSGSITLGGPVTMNQVLNLGTIISPVLQGTTSIAGQITGGTIGTIAVTRLNNGTYGTPTITGGTINPTAYQFGGTLGTTVDIPYVKSGTVAGTISVVGGLIVNVT
jgi:hypothetical protein